MGAGASITEPVDEAKAQELLGDKFDKAKFDEAAEEGDLHSRDWEREPIPSRGSYRDAKRVAEGGRDRDGYRRDDRGRDRSRVSRATSASTSSRTWYCCRSRCP